MHDDVVHARRPACRPTICAMLVSVPWPCGEVPVWTVDLPARLDADRRALPRPEATDLDVGADAHAHDPAVVAGLLLLLAKLRVVGHFERLVQRLHVLAGVVVGPERRLVRELVGRDEVACGAPRPGPGQARAPPCRSCTPAGRSPPGGRPRDTPQPGSCWSDALQLVRDVLDVVRAGQHQAGQHAHQRRDVLVVAADVADRRDLDAR